MDRAPRVTVVLTSYNHGRFVEESLRSVLDQSERDLEVVAVSQGVLTPRRDTEESVKLDRQLSKDHSLTLRYIFARQAMRTARSKRL